MRELHVSARCMSSMRKFTRVTAVAVAAAALYATDEAYGRLERLLVENPSPDPAAPDVHGGPGSDAINVTWLIHDVSVWRVDRVFTDAPGGPWIETIMSPNF